MNDYKCSREKGYFNNVKGWFVTPKDGGATIFFGGKLLRRDTDKAYHQESLLRWEAEEVAKIRQKENDAIPLV